MVPVKKAFYITPLFFNPMISLIVAYSKNKVIGNKNRIPWYIPNDLEYFRKLTLNQIIVMGRKTFDSIKQPLKDRTNIVLTRNNNLKIKDCIIMHSIAEVLRNFRNFFVIGGEEIYKQFLPVADTLYITLVDFNFEGDRFFPEIPKDFALVSKVKGIRNPQNHYDYYFLVLKRKNIYTKEPS